MPSAFTPNGDGRNDVFKIADMKNQQLIDFSIYDRWGERIFETKNPSYGWYGKWKGNDLPISTFVYIIWYKDFKGAAHYLKGTVSLIR
ncbi:MAG: T9SS type B sorting domain-containing protein [Chitinophagaceae bacterium]